MSIQDIMKLSLRHRMAVDLGEDGLGDLCLKLDLLHDAASIGRVEMVSDLPVGSLRSWLREIIFIARETLYELDATQDSVWH